MRYETRVVAHRTVARGTHEVTLERPDGFAFEAGQYTQVAVPRLLEPDSRGRSRQFSLASSPDDQAHVRVVFRETGSGFKRTLMAAAEGSTVEIEHAGGGFLLPQKLTRAQAFVAGGVGIAPFMSFLSRSSHERWPQSVTLFYGNRDPGSAAYLDELGSLADRQPSFSLHELYERPTPGLFSGLAKKHADAVWRIAGPEPMVAATVHGLHGGRVAALDIITESFTGY